MSIFFFKKKGDILLQRNLLSGEWITLKNIAPKKCFKSIKKPFTYVTINKIETCECDPLQRTLADEISMVTWLVLSPAATGVHTDGATILVPMAGDFTAV